MSTAGPNSGGNFVDDNSVGTIVWSNPGNAAASDDSRASAIAYVAHSTSHYLKATNFGFSIPAGATIDGITVEIEKREYNSANNIVDSSVKIVQDGTISGDDLKSGSEWPHEADAYSTYGNATSLWGLTWTPAQINSSSFGVAISAYFHDIRDLWIPAYVDHIQITVDYTEGVPLSFVAAIAGLSNTPNVPINTVTSERALLATITAASNTPDAKIIGQLQANIAAVSLTADIPLSAVTTARALLAGIVGASTTPDATAVVWLLGELLASIQATSLTGDIVATMTRNLLASVQGASLTEDITGTMPALATVIKSGWRGRELEQWKREKYPQVDRRLFLQDDKET